MAVKADYIRVSKSIKRKVLFFRLNEIAEQEGVNYASLSHFLAKQGICFTDLRREAMEKYILKEFFENRRVLSDIAGDLKVSYNNVYSILRNAGVKMRRGGRRVGEEWKERYFKKIEAMNANV